MATNERLTTVIRRSLQLLTVLETVKRGNTRRDCFHGVQSSKVTKAAVFGDIHYLLDWTNEVIFGIKWTTDKYKKGVQKAKNLKLSSILYI